MACAAAEMPLVMARWIAAVCAAVARMVRLSERCRTAAGDVETRRSIFAPAAAESVATTETTAVNVRLNDRAIDAMAVAEACQISAAARLSVPTGVVIDWASLAVERESAAAGELTPGE
jgi:hypothetical protein